QLEFILFLNSYLATQVPEAAQWVSQYRPDMSFDYWNSSDLWRYQLDAVVPVAERIYESLALGPDAAHLVDFSVEHSVFQKAFSPTPSTSPEQRQGFFVGYLNVLLKWHTQAGLSQWDDTYD